MELLLDNPARILRKTDVDTTIRLSGIVDQSIVDGPGLRMTVFTQGCPHHCAGCHNPTTHNTSQGFTASVGELLDRFDENPLLAGITLSGGEPLIQPQALAPLAARIKARNKSVWCYTGYTFEQVMRMANGNYSLMSLLRSVDVLVDGRYDAALQSLTLRFRGSANQRLVDMPLSLATGQAVLLPN